MSERKPFEPLKADWIQADGPEITGMETRWVRLDNANAAIAQDASFHSAEMTAVIEEAEKAWQAYGRELNNSDALKARLEEADGLLRDLFNSNLNEMTARNLPHEWTADSPMGRASAYLAKGKG